jgi:hypothetical protein
MASLTQAHTAAENCPFIEGILPLERNLDFLCWNFGLQGVELVIIAAERESKQDRK